MAGVDSGTLQIKGANSGHVRCWVGLHGLPSLLFPRYPSASMSIRGLRGQCCDVSKVPRILLEGCINDGVEVVCRVLRRRDGGEAALLRIPASVKRRNERQLIMACDLGKVRGN